MLQWWLEGIILIGGFYMLQVCCMLENLGIFVVEIWEIFEDLIDYVVGFFNSEVMVDLVCVFVVCGYCKFGYIGGMIVCDMCGSLCCVGFFKVVDEFGFGFGCVIFFGVLLILIEQGVQVVVFMLECWLDMDVVFCVFDFLVFGVLMECQWCGMKVLGDIVIVGFGDYEILVFCYLCIIIVNVDCYGIGKFVVG